MTRRRGTFIAVAAVAAVLITVGLGARRGGSDGPRGDVCEEHLDDVFEMCAESDFECLEVPDELADACEAACITSICPDQVPATELDSIWRLPCSDMHGARFWSDLDDGQIRCNHKFHVGHVDNIDWAAFHECWNADVEAHCPELAGTDWRAKFDAAMKK